MVYIVQGFLREFDKSGRPVAYPPERKFSVDYECDLMKELQECDIILYRYGGRKDLVGGVIAHITSSPYSHAEIHIRDGYDISAGPQGVTFVDGYAQNVFGTHAVVGGRAPTKVDVFRLKRELTREERLIIQAKAYQSLIMPYDYINLLSFPFASPKKIARMSGNAAYICAELTSWCYENANIDLIKAKATAIEAPADIGRSSILQYRGTFSQGKKLNGNFANEFIDEDYGLLQKIIAGGMELFSSRDEFYEGIRLNREQLEGEM